MPRPTSLEKKKVSWKQEKKKKEIYAYTMILGLTTRIY